MNLYYVYRTDRYSYDNYSSFVVVSENEEKAKSYIPNDNFGEILETRINYKENLLMTFGWTSMENIQVKLLGKMDSSLNLQEGSLIESSFHAG